MLRLVRFANSDDDSTLSCETVRLRVDVEFIVVSLIRFAN